MIHRRVLPLVVVLFATGLVVAQDRSRSLLPTDSAVARYGVARRWCGYAPVDGVREEVTNVMVVGDQVHLETNASRIHVMQGESGKLLWSAQMGRRTSGQFGSAINSKSVFALNGLNLYRLNR